MKKIWGCHGFFSKRQLIGVFQDFNKVGITTFSNLDTAGKITSDSPFVWLLGILFQKVTDLSLRDFLAIPLDHENEVN